MPVNLANNNVLEVVAGQKSFAPGAEEIFSVVFEGATELHGAAVSAGDFQATGVNFLPDASDPVAVFEARSNNGVPEITCHLAARNHGIEAPVSSHSGKLLDYAIAGKTWLPLPIGTLDEAAAFLRSAGITQFGPITLAQYMNVMRLRKPPLVIEDKTQNVLPAAAMAPTLSGDPPTSFRGSLYNYQLDGYRWLSFMRKNGLGSIIADEMGLGKTVQVICLILECVQKAAVPNLVVAPATLLENWRRELARFGPDLKVLVHGGSRRTGLPATLKAYDVVVTSFETAVSDISMFRNVKWNLFVLDEAQGIKNPAAKRSIQLKTIPRNIAVAVTGTPVENRLKDLWSVTDFAVPLLLGELADFEKHHPDTMTGASDLEPIVSPVILRRRVSEVARDLPKRIDIPQALELDSESIAAYEEIREQAAAENPTAAAITALTKLRMFCTHPWLTDKLRHHADAAECSPKFRRLLEILDEIIADGGKALIFTSYQDSIDMLVTEIASRTGIASDFIDGRVPVPERQKKVDVFAACATPAVLVLNPKAAGTGLNITAANHVIHYNLEWNPAVEDQASARAYRRGQTRPVTVHRFFYVNTVEEVINDRMIRKRDLANAAVIGTDGQEQEIADILRALRISPAANP